MSGAAIECQGLTKRYVTEAGEVHALRGLDLVVDSGELVAVTGPSGCGKTTLLNVLGALDRPTGGAVRVLGQDLSGLGTRERALYRRSSVGFIFQQFHLIPSLTALENVALPLHYAGVARAEARRRSLELLERVGLKERTTHFPALLSGGEQQRVAVARALVGGGKVLLADEPTGNLDAETATQIVDLLVESLGMGLTIVLVTHDPEVAQRAKRRIRLRDGTIEDASPSEEER